MSFEDAARVLFDDLPREAQIDVDIEGGGQVQIGDYTWDDEPINIVVSAFIPGLDHLIKNEKRNDLRKYRGKVWKREFESLPLLWAAMHPYEDD